MTTLLDSEIIKGRILAKSVIRTPNGKYRIIAIFDRGDYYRYFFIFDAKSARSNRRSWNYAHQRVMIYRGTQVIDGEKCDPFHTFDSFVDEYLKTSKAEEISRRVYVSKKKLHYFLDRTAHPTNYIIPSVAPVGSYRYSNAITSGKSRTGIKAPKW